MDAKPGDQIAVEAETVGQPNEGEVLEIVEVNTRHLLPSSLERWTQ